MLTPSATDATKLLKKYKFNLNNAMNAFYNEGGDVSRSSKSENQKKIGEIWERYKGESLSSLVIASGGATRYFLCVSSPY